MKKQLSILLSALIITACSGSSSKSTGKNTVIRPPQVKLELVKDKKWAYQLKSVPKYVKNESSRIRKKLRSLKKEDNDIIPRITFLAPSLANLMHTFNIQPHALFNLNSYSTKLSATLLDYSKPKKCIAKNDVQDIEYVEGTRLELYKNTFNKPSLTKGCYIVSPHHNTINKIEDAKVVENTERKDLEGNPYSIQNIGFFGKPDLEILQITKNKLVVVDNLYKLSYPNIIEDLKKAGLDYIEINLTDFQDYLVLLESFGKEFGQDRLIQTAYDNLNFVFNSIEKNKAALQEIDWSKIAFLYSKGKGIYAKTQNSIILAFLANQLEIDPKTFNSWLGSKQKYAENNTLIQDLVLNSDDFALKGINKIISSYSPFISKSFYESEWNTKATNTQLFQFSPEVYIVEEIEAVESNLPSKINQVVEIIININKKDKK